MDHGTKNSGVCPIPQDCWQQTFHTVSDQQWLEDFQKLLNRFSVHTSMVHTPLGKPQSSTCSRLPQTEESIPWEGKKRKKNASASLSADKMDNADAGEAGHSAL